MATLGKSQEGEEEKLTVPETLINDKRKVNMVLLNVCVFLHVIFFHVICTLLCFKMQLLCFHHICYICIILLNMNSY